MCVWRLISEIIISVHSQWKESFWPTQQGKQSRQRGWQKIMRLLVPAKQLRPPFGAKSLRESIFHFVGSPLGVVQPQWDPYQILLLHTNQINFATMQISKNNSRKRKYHYFRIWILNTLIENSLEKILLKWNWHLKSLNHSFPSGIVCPISRVMNSKALSFRSRTRQQKSQKEPVAPRIDLAKQSLVDTRSWTEHFSLAPGATGNLIHEHHHPH